MIYRSLIQNLKNKLFKNNFVDYEDRRIIYIGFLETKLDN